MQKLLLELENVPKNTHQVLCSTNLSLNKEETLSVISGLKNDKLDNNNPDGDLSESNRKQNLRVSVKVYVLNQRGNPLMPCSPRKAKQLLKQGRAKVVKCIPFTIQLTIATGEAKQDITLGIDTGYANVGVSVVTEKKELLSATFKLRTNVSSLLKEKKMYRRGRRNRLWYREPRWKNRANTRKDGRLMPSVLHKIQTHITIIDGIKKLLPVSKIILETGLFDMAKMENDSIKNYQYQKGEMYGFENVKAYILARDNHKCYFNDKCSEKLEVHHIKFKSQGGSDNPNNLITLCNKCHKKIHAGKLKLDVKKHKELKSATVMNVIRKRLLEFYTEAEETFGYETKVKRREIDLEKSHSNDAFVIAEGSNQERCLEYKIEQKKKNNRCLQLNRKGFKPSIRKQRYKFQPKDLVYIDGKWEETSGSHNKGTRILVDGKSISIKKVLKHFSTKTLIWRIGDSSTSLKA